MLKVIFTEDTKINQRLPSNKAIIDMCKASDIIVLPKDVINFVKVIANINIVKVAGSVKYFGKQRDMAFETLRKHFNIE